MDFLNYNEYDFGDIVKDKPQDFIDDYDNDPSLEELSFYPQNKFIKIVNFDLITDLVNNYEPEEYYHSEQGQEEIALVLFDHPFGKSSILDSAYQGLKASIQEKEDERLETCIKTAGITFKRFSDFQCQERSESCPVCLDDTFQTCERFYRCDVCQGGVCQDCGPLIKNKCPLCNVKEPLQKVCLKQMIQQERKKLPPSITVHELIYQKMYCPDGASNKTIFGHPADIKFNMEKLSSVEFDYEIAEFLRYTQKLLGERKHVLDESTYEEELHTKYWWARCLEPLFHL